MTAAERGIAYRERLDDRRVSPSDENIGRLAELGGSLPDEPACRRSS